MSEMPQIYNVSLDAYFPVTQKNIDEFMRRESMYRVHMQVLRVIDEEFTLARKLPNMTKKETIESICSRLKEIY